MDHDMMDKGQAQSEKHRDRFTIGMLIGVNTSQPVGWGAIDQAQKHDMNVFNFVGGVLHDDGFLSQQNIIYDLVDVDRLDGLVTWAGTGVAINRRVDEGQTVEFFRRYRSLPIVNYEQPIEGIPTVMTDTYQGMKKVLEHLIKVHQRRRILLLRGIHGHFESEERTRAYRDVLGEHGLPLEEERIYVTDGWNEEDGVVLMRQVFQDGLQPGKDYDAVAATESTFARGVLQVLQAHGVQVPGDVAVVGFNDELEDVATVPSITNARKSFYGAGCHAVDMLLDLMQGKPVPDVVELPPDLVIRRSCGCWNLDFDFVRLPVQATQEEAPKTCEQILKEQRQEIVADLALVADTWKEDWFVPLLDALVTDLHLPDDASPAEGLFLAALENTLHKVAEFQSDAFQGYAMLSVLRRHVLSCFEIGQFPDRVWALSWIEGLWKQAQVLVAREAHRAELSYRLHERVQSDVLNRFVQSAMTASRVPELMDVIARDLPKLGIPSCYLVLYQDPPAYPYTYPQPAPEWSRLILAYNEHGRMELEQEGRLFRTRQLVPEGVLPQDRSYCMIVQSLYWNEKQFGFILFEAGPHEDIYNVLRAQISNALQGVMSIEQQARLREASEQVQQQLAVALEEVNATQRRYLREAWTEYIQASEAVYGYVHSSEHTGLAQEEWLASMQDAVQQEASVVTHDPEHGSTLAVPLAPYGQIIGVLGGVGAAGDGWTDEEIAAVEAVVEQMALALESQRLQDEQQRASVLMGKRVRELDCLGDIGRKMEQAPSIPEFLQWVTERIPGAMQYPELCQVAIEFEDQVYGVAEALQLPQQMVQGLRIGNELVGRLCIAYVEAHDFLDEESALLGDVARRVSGYVETQRLLEQTRARSEELLVLNELGQALTARLNLDDVLEEAYRQTCRLMDATNFYIGIYDQEAEMLNFVFQVSDSEIDRSILGISVHEGVGGYIVRNRQSVLLEDRVDQRLRKLGIELVGQAAASWLGVPMMIGERVIGVISVQSHTTPGLYGPHEQELLSAIANPTAIAVQNAQLLEQTRQRAQEMSVLYELGQTLTAQLDLDQVLKQVYQGAARLIDASNFGIGLYDPEQRAISFLLNVTESEVDKEIAVISSDEGISGYVVRTAKSLLLKQDIERWMEEHGMQPVGEIAQCWLGVPLLIGNQVRGVIFVQDYHTAGAYDEGDLRTLEAIASQASVAIQNAQLFEEMTVRNQRQAAIAEVTQQVLGQQDVDAVVQTVTDSLVEAWNGALVRIWLLEEEELILRASSGLSTRLDGVHARKSLEQVNKISAVARSREAKLSRNLLGDPEFVDPEWIRQEKLQSFVGYPIFFGQQVAGVLGFFTRELVSDAEFSMLGGLVTQLALVLETLRFLTLERARARREQILREITTRVRGAADPDVVVRAAIRELGTALGRSTFVRLGDAEQLLQRSSE